MVKHLKGLEINSIYDFDNAFSINELLCKFWEKIEETINISNESIDILNWIKEEGLPNEVQVLINQLVADGTIEQMINVDKIDEVKTLITNKITDVREQLDTNVRELNNKINEVATTGTTMETVQNKVSEMAQNGLINFNTVMPNMTTFLKESRNLIDENKFSKSVYINAIDGNITNNDSYKTTDYIELEKNKNYVFSNEIDSVIRSITYYDAGKTFIVGGEKISSFNSGTTYKYCRLSITSIATKNQLEIGTVSTEYMPYGKFEVKFPVPAKNITGKIEDEQLDMVTVSKNLIDENTIENDKYLDVNGNISVNTTYKVTGYIELEKLTNYHYSDREGNLIRCINFYDIDKTRLIALENVSDFNTKETYGKVAYCRLSLYKSATEIQLEKGTISTGYVKKGEKYLNTKVNVENIIGLDKKISELSKINPLYGKKVIGFGDSIMFGHGYAGGFLKIIADRNNMTLINKGVSGSTVASHNGIVCIMRTLELHQGDLDADYVILEGGTNDALDQFAEDVGEITEGYNAELDYNTYCKSFEKMLKIAIERWAGKKILYVCVHNMNSRTNLKLFMDLAKQMCRKWSVPYIDLFEEGGMLSQLDSIRQAYTSDGDGTHPNEEGYRKYYCDKIEAKMKQI